MNRDVSFLVVSLGVAFSVACRPGMTGLSEEDREAIRQMDDDWFQAVVSDSPDLDARIPTYYAEDAQILMANMPAIVGHEAIKATVSQMPRITSFRFTEVSLEGAGHLAFRQYSYDATFVLPGASQPLADRGKGIEVFRRQADGTWRVIRDVGNSDLPPLGMMLATGSLKPDAGAELKRLNGLAGTWKIEGHEKAAGGRPAGKTSVTLTCRWFDGGQHLVCQYEGVSPAGPFHKLDIYGYDTATSAYTLWFIDSAGMAGIGRLTIDGTTWTHVWDVRAGVQTMKVRLTMTNRTPASGDWRIETAVAGGPWTIIGEGTHQRTN